MKISASLSALLSLARGQAEDLSMDLASELAFQASTEDVVAPRGGSGPKNKVITIDQNWKDFDTRAAFLFEQLYPTVILEPEWKANEQEIVKADQKLCEEGVDPHGRKINCEKDGIRNVSGDLVPKTKFQTAPRKFRQLKILVLWLQQSPRFGRYCYYGCYCLPEGAHYLGADSFGKVVDPIDRSCKVFNQCYECLKLGNFNVQGTSATCDGNVTKYRFQLIQNKETGTKSIKCMNPEGTCERNVCECDKKLAENLSKWEDDWNSKYHTNLGDGSWQYKQECVKSGGNRYSRPQTCCGTSFPDMKPRQGGKDCCGSTPFDPLEKKCCADEKVRGSC